jgi:DNA-binding NarL/FixJ family response regulator
MEALRILVADDHPAVRILLRNILETVPRWNVCGEAENGSSAVALATSLRPDIIVMDLVMPEINGLEATRQVLKFNPQARVILTTLHCMNFRRLLTRREGQAPAAVFSSRVRKASHPGGASGDKVQGIFHAG